MEEKYILVEVYGSKVICNCPYSSLETAKESLRAAFDNITNDIYNLEYGKDCWKSDDGMSAWATHKNQDRVWSIVKALR